MKPRSALGSWLRSVRPDRKTLLSGVDPVLIEQAQRNRRVDITGPVRAFAATELIGEDRT